MTIYEQLQEFCGCLEVKEQDVDELVNVISIATGWTNQPCDTFLISERKEVVDLPDCRKSCDIFKFEPYYFPYDVDSFKFKIIKVNGIEETEIEVTEYIYSEVDNVFKIKLPIDDCFCGNRCNCKPSYKLIVTYDAGFNEIPDCLLPVFCDLLDLIYRKNQCNCDCSTCEADNYDNKVDYGNYTVGDAITYEEVIDFSKLLSKQYRKQLGLISLIKPDAFYGMVVK